MMDDREMRGANAWNCIFQEQGHVFPEPFPEYEWLLGEYQARGVRRVLDLGCGSGRHVVALSQAGMRVTGMDLAAEGLRLTRAWLDEEGLAADLLMADFRRPFPLQADYFDGIISTQVIHHALLAGVLNAVEHIDRVLAPGGLLFVVVSGRFTDENFKEVEPGTFVPLDGHEEGLPHHIFSLEGLAEAFAKFNILDIGPRAGGKVQVVLAEKNGRETRDGRRGIVGKG